MESSISIVTAPDPAKPDTGDTRELEIPHPDTLAAARLAKKVVAKKGRLARLRGLPPFRHVGSGYPGTSEVETKSGCN